MEKCFGPISSPHPAITFFATWLWTPLSEAVPTPWLQLAHMICLTKGIQAERMRAEAQSVPMRWRWPPRALASARTEHPLTLAASSSDYTHVSKVQTAARDQALVQQLKTEAKPSPSWPTNPWTRMNGYSYSFQPLILGMISYKPVGPMCFLKAPLEQYICE